MSRKAIIWRRTVWESLYGAQSKREKSNGPRSIMAGGTEARCCDPNGEGDYDYAVRFYNISNNRASLILITNCGG